ncbi:MAG: orotate phosphoribosyltransferase [Thermoplasmataceae archaeon]|jgi:orotate phosphoribosyltransferase|nr:MAG: orotate phosphoribosyltransferase [Thermoplasmatales archaeon E-plasma]
MLNRILQEKGAIKTGEFTLTSGKKSNFYVDIKDACADPEVLKVIVGELEKKVTSKAVAGVELGAVPLVVATAFKMSIPYFIIRKQSNHGMKKLLIGKPEEGVNVDIIEDVVTTGGSVLKAANLLMSNGMKIGKIITVVDREEGGIELLRENGLKLESLVKISEVLKK